MSDITISFSDRQFKFICDAYKIDPSDSDRVDRFLKTLPYCVMAYPLLIASLNEIVGAVQADIIVKACSLAVLSLCCEKYKGGDTDV